VTRSFDLEDPVADAQLAEPRTALGTLRGLVVVDEVQRAPALFPVRRVLADRPRTPARFLPLASASPELVRASSEYGDAPRLTRSMRVAMADLGLSQLYVVYPGTERYGLAHGVEAISLPEPLDVLARSRKRR
jgi:hypothetical protein